MPTKSTKSDSAQAELVMFRARTTLSQEEAVRFLFLQFNVNVGLDALWAHVLDRHLVLSIEFDGLTHGRRGRVVPRAEHHAVKFTPWISEKREFRVEVPSEETRAFNPGEVVELPKGHAERMQGAWDLCCVGDWQQITRGLSNGRLNLDRSAITFDDRLDIPSVFVGRPSEPEFAWEITTLEGGTTREFLDTARPAFRPAALEKFIANLVKPRPEDEFNGRLRIATLLSMVGALIDADGNRKTLLYDLEKTTLRGFSERNLDDYFKAATEEFEKARAAVLRRQ